MNWAGDQPELKNAQRAEGPEQSSAAGPAERSAGGYAAWPGSSAANAWQAAVGHHQPRGQRGALRGTVNAVPHRVNRIFFFFFFCKKQAK